MALTLGTRLGVYEIIAPIGEGGMGQVFRARDTKLDRDVAIKILPEAFAHDTDRLSRFTREAKTLAALNHPNIAAIHGLEESAGITALVMELVEGDDLSQRIARGPIPLNELLPIAKQIAEALEGAHEQGIIHRDLKPANIKVRADGLVKVLDFGLAKAMAPIAGSSPSLSLPPTLTSPAMMTGAGLILGTAAYMAPEQAKGRAVDKRADIWAFGVVLHEMLTGRRLFEAEDMSETLAAVLTRDVSLTTLPDAIPARVRALLRECLVRDPRQRLRDIGDGRIALEQTIAGFPDATAAPPAGTVRVASVGQRWLLWTAAGVLAVGLGIALWAPWRHAVRGPGLRLTAEIGAAASLVLAGSGNGTAVIFSPDGTLLAFVAQTTVGAASQLYVRRLDQLAATPLPGTDDAASPFFSPDGHWIAFFAGGKLKKISVAGGTPFTVCDASNSRGGDWAEDGTIVLQPSGGAGGFLMHVAAAGGTPERLTTLEPGEQTQRWPQVLPGSRGLIYTSSNAMGNYGEASIVVQPWPHGPRKVLIKGGYFGRYVPSGHLLYVHEGALFAAPFDIARLEVTGPSVPVLEDVGLGVVNGSAQFAASSTGTLAYVTRQSSLTSMAAPITWLDRHGKTTPMRTTLGDWSNVQVSPDGQRLALDINDGRQTDIWVYDWARDAMTRVTFDPGEHWMPVWTPDALHLTFRGSQTGGAPNLFWRRADGGGDIQRLTTSPTSQYTGSWHPSARTLAFAVAGNAGSDLMLLPMDGSEASGWRPGTPTPFLAGHSGVAPAFSPDGRWIAYHSNDSGSNQVYVQPFPGPGGKWLISTDGGAFPVWSRARQELLYAGVDNRIMMVSYSATGDSFTASKPRPWADTRFLKRSRGFGNADGRPFDLHPDGERVAMAPIPENERFERRDKVVLVFNFFDELRRIAPVTRP